MQRIVSTYYTNRLVMRSFFTVPSRHNHVSTAAFRASTSRWALLYLSNKVHDQTQSYCPPSKQQQQIHTYVNPNNNKKTQGTIPHRLLLPWQGSLSLMGSDIQQNRTMNNYQRRCFFTSSNWQDKDSPYTIIGVRYYCNTPTKHTHSDILSL